MKNGIKHIWVFLVVILSFNALAYTPDSLVSIGNRAYNQGLYDSALRIYEKVLAQNLHSPQLYYNIGNAHFKNNDIPSAILFFEKAKKTCPTR